VTDPMLGGGEGTRAAAMVDSLVEITSALVDGPDSATVLRLVSDAGIRLLGAAATGVMVTDPRGGVEVVAASDRPARFVELLQTQIEQGPCLDCIAAGTVVTAADLGAERERWPDFVPAALDAGYRAVAAIPLRLNGRTVGGLNLLYTETTTLSARQVSLAQVVSDLAALGLVQENGDRRADRLAERTLTALNQLVHVDQAVGLVAGTLGVEPAAARTAITTYARDHRRPLHEIARAVTDGDLDPADLAELTVGDNPDQPG
jgi:GAF domain-containing protein